jgi:hypothetical protein
VEGFQLFAAGDIIARLFQEQDVGEACRGGCGAEEDEVGRDAFGSPSRDDSDHLWKIADQKTDDYKTAQLCQLRSWLGSARQRGDGGLALIPPG